MDPHSGYCEGCFRSVDEITVWSSANDCMKRAILVQVDKRRAAATAQPASRRGEAR